jgi:hypothetical protein
VLRSFSALDAWDDDFLPAELASAMRTVGFKEIETIEVTCPLGFRDEEEWWAWSWSHGPRGLFEAVPDHKRAALRQALFNGLQNCKRNDGLFHGSMSATIARASRRISAR